MQVLLLTDLEEYLAGLLQRMQKSGRATEHDITMTRYNLEVIQDRIREKEQQK